MGSAAEPLTCKHSDDCGSGNFCAFKASGDGVCATRESNPADTAGQVATQQFVIVGGLAVLDVALLCGLLLLVVLWRRA